MNEPEVVLETPRLRLRRFAAGDADDLWALDQDPEVLRYLGAPPPRPPSLEQVSNQALPAFIAYYTQRPGYGFWAAETREGRAFVGWFHLRPTEREGEADLGYRLRRQAWGRGYGTEGSSGLIDLAFSRPDIHRVIAIAMPQNRASVRVMQKAGMAFERRFVHPAGPEVVQYCIRRSAVRAPWQKNLSVR